MATEKKVEKNDRELRFEALLAAYEKQNPAKYAAKKSRGEFDKIPDSFV